MNANQGKFRPTISAIDEVDDRNLKLDDAKQQIEGSETAPLTTNQMKLNIDQTVAASKDLESQNDRHDNDRQADTPISGGAGSVNGFRGEYFFVVIVSIPLINIIALHMSCTHLTHFILFSLFCFLFWGNVSGFQLF